MAKFMLLESPLGEYRFWVNLEAITYIQEMKQGGSIIHSSISTMRTGSRPARPRHS
jgi:hypothetical protein